MGVRREIVKQFHHPRGILGRLAGWIMSRRASNLARNRWTVDLLNLESHHRVLELGPGPGVTLGLILARVTEGTVTAVDHSQLMLQQCRRRNWRALGRLTLIQHEFPGIPGDQAYDRIVAVNSLQFDALNAAMFSDIAGHLSAGGKVAVTFQPRGANPTQAGAMKVADDVGKLMREAGLNVLGVEQLAMAPVSAVCVIASKDEVT